MKKMTNLSIEQDVSKRITLNIKNTAQFNSLTNENFINITGRLNDFFGDEKKIVIKLYIEFLNKSILFSTLDLNNLAPFIETNAEFSKITKNFKKNLNKRFTINAIVIKKMIDAKPRTYFNILQIFRE